MNLGGKGKQCLGKWSCFKFLCLKDNYIAFLSILTSILIIVFWYFIKIIIVWDRRWVLFFNGVVRVKVAQSCLTVYNPMGYTVHEFSRPVEWVDFPSSRGSSQPRDWTMVSHIASGFFLLVEPPGKPKNTGVGSLSFLQRIFPTQESNWSVLHCRQILYQLSYQGRVYSFPGGTSGKESICKCGRWKTCWFDPWVGKIPWRKEMVTHSSILAWRIPWTEEPGGLQSIGLQRVNTTEHTHTHSIWWLHGIALKTWPHSPKCWNMNVNIHACSYLPLLQFTINQITWESNPVKDLHAPSSATWAARSPLFCSPSFSIELLKPMPWSPTQQWFSGPCWSDLVNPVVLIAP